MTQLVWTCAAAGPAGLIAHERTHVASAECARSLVRMSECAQRGASNLRLSAGNMLINEYYVLHTDPYNSVIINPKVVPCQY